MKVKPKNIINIENIANNMIINKDLSPDEKRDIVTYSSLKRNRRYLLNHLKKLLLKNGLNLIDISLII